MMTGHLIVVVTFLWMQPRVLQSTMGGMETTERIKQVVSEATPAVEASTPSKVSAGSTVMEGVNDGSDADVQATPAGVREQTAAELAGTQEIPVASSSSGPQGDAIGEDVSWTEPEVLAGDVAWDDDDIELVD